MESYAMRYGLVLKITVTGIFFKKVTVYVTGSKKGIAIFKGAFGL